MPAVRSISPFSRAGAYTESGFIVDPDGLFESVAKLSSSDQQKIDEYEKKQEELQDKIDAVLTNRGAGLPIFAVIMFAVFWISLQTYNIG